MSSAKYISLHVLMRVSSVRFCARCFAIIIGLLAFAIAPSPRAQARTCPVPIDAAEETGWIDAVHDVSGTPIITADRGLFEFSDGRLQRIPSAVITGRIVDIRTVGGVVWIAAELGVFRLERGGAGDYQLVRIPSAQETGAILGMGEGSDLVWVVAELGVFRLEVGEPGENRLMKIQDFDETGVISDVMEVGGVVWSFADDRLFRIDGGQPVRMAPDRQTGLIRNIREASDDLFIEVGERILRLGNDRFFKFVVENEFEAILGIREEDGDLLVRTSQGGFRLGRDGLMTVAEDLRIRAILGLREDSRGLWLRTDRGEFLIGHRVSDLGDRNTGWIQERQLRNTGVLVRAEKGDFLVDGDRLLKVTAPQDLQALYADGRLWIGMDEGLFVLEGDRLVKMDLNQATGHIRKLHDNSGVILVEAEAGLFLLEGDRLVGIDTGRVAGGVRGVREADDRLLIRGEADLFRLAGDRLVKIDADRATGQIREVHDTSGVILVEAEAGLFRLVNDRLIDIDTNQVKLQVRNLYGVSGVILLETEAGLFRLADDRLVNIDTTQLTGRIRGIHQADGRLLIGGDADLFRLDDDWLVRLNADQETGEHQRLFSFGSTVWLDARHGVFRLQDDRLLKISERRSSNTQSKKMPSHHLYVDSGRLFRDLDLESGQALEVLKQPLAQIVTNSNSQTISADWEFRHACILNISSEHLHIDGIPADWVAGLRPTTTKPDKDSEYITTIESKINFLKHGEYNMQLLINEPDLGSILVGRQIEARIGWSLGDYAKYYGARLGVVLIVMHTISFVVLIACSRWSTWCWRVVGDPIWGKLGLWFHFALRHSSVLQRWVLERWFQNVRRQVDSQPYLPMPLKRKQDRSVDSSNLLEQLSTTPRIWVQGNAGMGKTALIEDIKGKYFGGPELRTLASAYQRYRFAPIVVPLREYRALTSEKAEDWPLEAARKVMSAGGMFFPDEGLFRAIVRSGRFALLLDGLNEVGRYEEVRLFAGATPEVRILVTSQADGYEAFQTWHLPATITEAIGPLLRLYLGNARGTSTYRRIAATSLVGALRSGYDVRLIADLVEDRGEDCTLPTDRLGLYRAIFDAVQLADGSRYPEETLCRAAWRMWRDGERKLVPGEHVDSDLIQPLLTERQKVLRVLSTDRYEFRHDQMRAYLAARWAAVHEVHPVRLFENDATIWRLARSDQEEVWEFFAEMIDPIQGAILWEWAAGDPERAVLQHALQQVGLKQGWHLALRTAAA